MTLLISYRCDLCGYDTQGDKSPLKIYSASMDYDGYDNPYLNLELVSPDDTAISHICSRCVKDIQNLTGTIE